MTHSFGHSLRFYRQPLNTTQYIWKNDCSCGSNIGVTVGWRVQSEERYSRCFVRYKRWAVSPRSLRSAACFYLLWVTCPCTHPWKQLCMCSQMPCGREHEKWTRRLVQWKVSSAWKKSKNKNRKKKLSTRRCSLLWNVLHISARSVWRWCVGTIWFSFQLCAIRSPVLFLAHIGHSAAWMEQPVLPSCRPKLQLQINHKCSATNHSARFTWYKPIRERYYKCKW